MATPTRRTLAGIASAAFFTATMTGGCSVDVPTVNLAIVDSGVATDLDAFAKYRIITANQSLSSTHGTMMASVALGLNDENARPIDPDRIELVSVNIDGAERGSDVDLAEGIVTAVDEGADVILVSRGVRRDVPEIREAVQLAREAGAVVVAAAGNVRFLPPDYPARYESVVSVGAAEDSDQPWSGSARTGVDTFALGVDVPVLDSDGVRRIESGTSIAAALVANDLLHQLVDGEIAHPNEYEPPEYLKPSL